MKRFFVGVIFFLLVSIGFSEEFDLGAIEVTDISAKLDANALEKDKVKALEKENLNIDYKGSDLGNRQKIADELVPDVTERSAFANILIGDDSKNDLRLYYSEKNINYLWSGKVELLSDDVMVINGKEKTRNIEFEYDDVWENISFSTESLFSHIENDVKGSDTVINNSYHVEEDILDLRGNVFFSPLKNWNFFGRIAKFEKEMSSVFAGGYNSDYENSIFDGKAYTQIDLSESSFVDITIGLKTDSLDFTGGSIDNDRFDMEFDMNIVRTDFSVVSTLGIFTSDDDDETAFHIDYTKYGKDNKNMKFGLGKKYTPLDYEKVFFDREQYYIVRMPVFRDAVGEVNNFLSVSYDFDYMGAECNVVTGTESVDNKLFYSKFAANEKSLTPGYIGSADNFFIHFTAKAELRGKRDLTLYYNHNNWDMKIPFTPENTWKAVYRHEYDKETVFTIESVFTGKYEDGLGVENDGYVLVNLSMDNKIDEKMNFRIDVLNVMDKEYTVVPGFSEDERQIQLGFSFNL